MPKKNPQHIAVIMDGNGRWAQKRLLPRIAGHKAGMESVRKIIRCCMENEIKVLTLFAFSSENWLRPQKEIAGLMRLFLSALKTEVSKLHENNIQLKIIGNDTRFSADIKKAMQDAIQLTSQNTGLTLVIALDYGGQWDIVEASKKISQEIKSGRKMLDDITPEYFETKLSTEGLPSPDLFIRTSGEQRISNFLLWQIAYTELYFTPVFWPDFDENIFNEALQFYHQRERRFGGLKHKGNE